MSSRSQQWGDPMANLRFLSRCLPSLLLMGALPGCSQAPESSTVQANRDPGSEDLGLAPEDLGLAPEALAKQVAADELAASSVRSDKDAWTSESEITEAFPIYRPGSDEIAYFECKVMTAGQDAGSILVNVDQSDILIPEARPAGKTTTEQYAERLGHRAFRVVRYDWFRSAALGNDGTVLAKQGFGGDEADAQTRMRAFERANVERRAFPLYSRSLLDSYYKELSTDDSAGSRTGDVGTVQQAKTEWRSTYSELKNSFSAGVHTPSWYQIEVDGGYPVGCAATAWAIVYGYWRQFKGAGRLFDSLDLTDKWESAGATNHVEIQDAMRSCASAMGTSYGGEGDEKYGLTWPWDTCKATSYGSDLGYSTSCSRDRGSEYSKFDKINGALSDDRPAILLIGADENDVIGNHYVVVEAAEKSQMKYLWVWHDRNVKYLVNYGWGGNDRKWIYVRDWGLNQHDVYSSFSNYTISLTIPSGPAHGGAVFGGHEYRFNDTLRSWTDARQYCANRGAHLVTIGSAEENEFVRQMLLQSSRVRTWIGLERIGTSTSWRWVNGEPVSYTNWISGEPNNDGGTERFVELRSTGWNDLPSTWTAAAVCEWE